jgi:hypothetical protein
VTACRTRHSSLAGIEYCIRGACEDSHSRVQEVTDITRRTVYLIQSWRKPRVSCRFPGGAFAIPRGLVFSRLSTKAMPPLRCLVGTADCQPARSLRGARCFLMGCVTTEFGVRLPYVTVGQANYPRRSGSRFSGQIRRPNADATGPLRAVDFVPEKEACEYLQIAGQALLRTPHCCLPHTVCNLVTSFSSSR